VYTELPEIVSVLMLNVIVPAGADLFALIVFKNGIELTDTDATDAST
jgi:hypothetical protein